MAPDLLTRARQIGGEISHRYRHRRGRTLVVREVTTIGVVGSLTLVTDAVGPWRVGAVLPRRQALELALRMFLDTPVSQVVVALPTAEPVWVVFERDELLAGLDATSMLQRISGSLAREDPEADALVDAATRRRIFRPLPMLPPPDDTIYAIRLVDS